MFFEKKVNSKTRYHPDEIPKAFRYHSEGREKDDKVKIIKNHFVENTNIKFGEDDSKILLWGK